MIHNTFEKDIEELSGLTTQLVNSCSEKESQLSEKLGLIHAELRCLYNLKPGEIVNNKTVAARMNLSTSRLTRIMDGLVTKGYVSRDIDPKMRRAVCITLTPKGEQIVKQLEMTYDDVYKYLLQNIDEAQYESVLAAVKSLLYKLNEKVK